MTHDYHTQVAATRARIFEKLYNRLIAAAAYKHRRYIVDEDDVYKMSREFAHDVAQMLQQRSGYVCKVKGGRVFSLSPRYVECKFVPVANAP